MSAILDSLVKRVNDLLSRVAKLEHLESGTGWKDYSAGSTVVGWASFTTKQIYYRKSGKRVFVSVRLAGTSNSTSTTFTLPDAFGGPISNVWCFVRDNNVDNFGNFSLPTSGNTVTVYLQYASAWTNTGTKIVSGEFWYQSA